MLVAEPMAGDTNTDSIGDLKALVRVYFDADCPTKLSCKNGRVNEEHQKDLKVLPTFRQHVGLPLWEIGSDLGITQPSNGCQATFVAAEDKLVLHVSSHRRPSAY